MTEEPTEPKKRKVFISYSWTTPEHEQWVVDLATRLVNDGIDAVLDKWNLRAGQDKYHFVEQMVNDPTVDKVLILMVCDRLYSEKANGREGGVGTETQIVSPEVYASADQTKFIPVITEKNPEGHAYTPIYLKSRIYVDMSTLALAVEKYEELVRLIYEKPQFKKPPLGTAPAYIRDEGRVVPRSSGKIFSLRSALENDRPSRIQLGLLQDVLNIFSEELEALLLQDDSLPLDEQVVQAIDRFTPYRDDFVETTDLIASLGTTPGLFRQFTRFFENQVPHIYSRYESRNKDHKKFIVYELLLYYTAVLMQRARFAELDVLLSHYYILTETDSNRPMTFDFSCFGRYNYALDQDRKRRLDSRKISLTADLLRERAKIDGSLRKPCRGGHAPLPPVCIRQQKFRRDI